MDSPSTTVHLPVCLRLRVHTWQSETQRVLMPRVLCSTPQDKSYTMQCGSGVQSSPWPQDASGVNRAWESSPWVVRTAWKLTPPNDIQWPPIHHNRASGEETGERDGTEGTGREGDGRKELSFAVTTQACFTGERSRGR